MEEEQIKKILKNLDTTDKKVPVFDPGFDDEAVALAVESASESSPIDLSNANIDIVLDKENMDKDEMIMDLKRELENMSLLNHLLSQMYNNETYFHCDIGMNDSPHAILDSHGDVIIAIPNTSSDSALLALYLCTLFNKIYLLSSTVTDMSEIHNSIRLVLDNMGV